MRQTKFLVFGIVAASLVLGTGNLLYADGAAKAPRAGTKAARRRAAAKVAAQKRGQNAATPGMPSGIGVIPDTTDTGTNVAGSGTIKEYRNDLGQTVYEISASQFDISPPLADMAVSASTEKAAEVEPSINPMLPPWRVPRSDVPDPVVQIAPSAGEFLTSGGFTPAAPSTGFNFEGAAQVNTITPPDTNGSVGYDGTTAQYVETVNLQYQVWSLNHTTNTATSIAGPTSINALWSGFGGPCQSQNSGDPIVLYDKVANRWLISQFTSTASSGFYYQCVAVSTTSNATGSYARWAFQVPSGRFGDYPHIGVWTDAYYMMAHAFSGQTFIAAIFAAMDRTKMLAGNSGATWQVILDTTEGGHQPADLDGFAPPPTNAPGIFLSLHGNGMVIYRMKVDFVTPANTVKTKQATVPVAASSGACLAAATSGTCIPQPGVSNLLDSLGDRLMFRAAYRNFIDHESIVISHSVDPSVTGLVSGVRWYDFRLSGTPDATCPTYPCTYQQGTIADVANGRSRWMPSIAMDGAENILVGYSTTGKTANTENQSIRYTGRSKGDTLGQMTVPEATIRTGTANYTGASRWGDYTSMSIDPFDDCTFWYANEYVTATSSWRTRIASATYPAGSGAGQCAPTTCLSRPSSAPTIGSASPAGPNQISATWTGIAPQPGAYAIERAVGACGSEGLYQPLAAVAGAAGSYTDTTVVGGLTYSYRVIAATDAAGKCQALSASACVSATATGTCNLKPVFTGAGSGTSNNSATCGVNVGWTPATSSCPLTPNIRYNIFRGTVPNFVPSAGNRIATCVSGPSSYLDQNNLSSGVTYYYVVRAEDDSTGNGGECGGGNEEANSVVASGTAYGVGTQASPGTWTDGGGDSTAFLLLNVAGTGDTSDQAWRFVSTATDAGANHTSGGAYAYRNAGPAPTDTYAAGACTEAQTPSLTVGATTTNLMYWERHQLEYHWDGVAVEYSKNGGAWTDIPAPSNSTGVGCSASDTTSDWQNFSCTGSPAANACGYITTKSAYNGPLGSGTACATWVTSSTVTSYAHRCHQITALTAGDTIKFRWRFSSDTGANYAGFYLDDVAVTNLRLPNACSSDPCAGQSDGTACTNDGNPCTTDVCSSGVCTHAAGNAGTTCRAAANECDLAETCTGSSTSCPADVVKTAGTGCTDDGNVCTTDACNGTVGAPACIHNAGNAGTTCRAAANECDLAESCTGSSTSCPADQVKGVGTSCTDDGNVCTTDRCNGTVGSPACVHNAGNAGTTCRAATNECDLAEACTGSSTACPADQVRGPGTSCSSDGNVCTTDLCNGTVGAPACVHNAGNAGTTCRAATNECDLAETCTGSSTTCPADAVKGQGTACTDDGNVCTTDQCNGTVGAAACVHDATTGTVSTTTCGVGACASTGVIACDNGVLQPDTCTPGTPQPETCNNIDDNCDGVVDEGLTQPTTCGTGACASTGHTTCVAGSYANDTCTPGTPQPETCNNIDDNCDGTVDEGLTQPTTCGVGACASTGYTTCVAGSYVNDTCTPGTPQPETCNNIDDNCDGTVDEGLTQPTTCGVGSCASSGYTTCVAGSYVNDTCTRGTPQPETCNGIDDNCDGVVDEGLTQPTTCGVGACASTGYTSCVNGSYVNDTCAPGSPTPETCNGIDDNCDGTVDEGLTQPTTCGVGACASTGYTTCVNGSYVNDTCTPGTPQPETCNGVDDNCDGTVDEGLTQATTCGVGACASTGYTTCVNGSYVNDTCTPGTPHPETCNGIDDNCNGSVDEGTDVPTTCGVGDCGSTGVEACVNGVLQPDTCTPPSGTVCDDGNPCTVGDTCGGGVCNAGSTITAPPETANVAASNDKATYTWSSATFATRYDVVRGSLTALPVGPGHGDELCFDNLTGTTLVDTADPDPDAGFWYLSRGENSCGFGTYGTQSDGTPRITTTCP